MATYASLNDDDHELGVYRTTDMEVVLKVLAQQQITIETVKDDLNDIKEALETEGEDAKELYLIKGMGLELVNSTLIFLNEEKGIL
jgi:endonuclease III-like uncharacterized protein